MGHSRSFGRDQLKLKIDNMKESHYVPKFQPLKHECSSLEVEVKEVWLEERKDEGYEDSSQYLLSQSKDLKKGNAIVLFSMEENKWIQAHLLNDSGNHDRRRGLLYWNFQLEDNIWEGGTCLFQGTLWEVLREDIVVHP